MIKGDAMNFLEDFFSKIWSSSGFLLIIILTFIYFSFYTIKGERGFVSYVRLTDELKQARQASEKYSKEKAFWEEKVRLLSAENLDLDMLDERARVVLNMVDSKEFVILEDIPNEE